MVSITDAMGGPIIVGGAILTLEPSTDSAAEAESHYGTISPAHVWRGYQTNVPVLLPAEADTAVFIVTYTWAEPVGPAGAVWFSDAADQTCGHVVDDAFDLLGPPSGVSDTRAQNLSLAVSPNPVVRDASIVMGLAVGADVELAVYDISGRRVALLERRAFTAGTHSLSWDGRLANGRQAGAGVYLYRLRAGKETHVTRVVRIE